MPPSGTVGTPGSPCDPFVRVRGRESRVLCASFRVNETGVILSAKHPVLDRDVHQGLDGSSQVIEAWVRNRRKRTPMHSYDTVSSYVIVLSL